MGFKVAKERCNECLFSDNKIVSNKRRKQVLDECRSQDAHFVCHKFTIANQEACCKGFYDSFGTNLIRIAQRLDVVEFVDFPEVDHD